MPTNQDLLKLTKDLNEYDIWLGGEVIWSRGLLKKGWGLCHGTAGNGYAFIHLYQITKV